MIVEDLDVFRNWLTAVLKPICEADPSALAKYVLALLKKDQPDEELRSILQGQLEVFLEDHTKQFVKEVFHMLSTKEYMKVSETTPGANPSNPAPTISISTSSSTPPSPKINKELLRPVIEPSELPDLNDIPTPLAPEKKERKERRDSENGEAANRRRRRSESRSRSWDRTKRSKSRSTERVKSRDRAKSKEDRHERSLYKVEKRERGERGKIWRNRSPNRRYDRRKTRSRSFSPNDIGSRSRSPRHHRPRYNRNSRSRSKSADRNSKNSKYVNCLPGAPVTLVAAASSTDNGEVDPSMAHVNPIVPGVPSNTNVPGVAATSTKGRCRDYDVMGFCMQGEMCPYDHGPDPVLLDDATLPKVLSYSPSPQTAPPPAYNPQAPQMWGDAMNPRMRGPRHRMTSMNQFMPQHPGMQRELIPVPVVTDNTKPPGSMPPGGFAGVPFGNPGVAPPQAYGSGGMPVVHSGLEGTTVHTGYRKKFDYNRLGQRKNYTNCTLALKKIPAGLNTITHLNNHFSKFGTIVNIQVQYQNDLEAALITFSAHHEANSAYRSTEPILNNRFIKVFWHDAENKTDNTGSNNSVPAGTGSENQPPNDNNDPAYRLEDVSNIKVEPQERPASKEEIKLQAAAAVKKNQDLLAAQAKMNKTKDDQRNHVLKLQNDITKRKQELLEKQVAQLKDLLMKMSKIPPGPQRDSLKLTIQKTEESIEATKKDVEKATLAAKVATGGKKSKEETQKELLDMELDLIAKQQEGQDTTELQLKLTELKAHASLIKTPATRGRGRARYTPIGRHLLTKNNVVDKQYKMTGKIKTVNKIINNPSFVTSTTLKPTSTSPSHALDNRTTRLLVSGYELDDQEAVISHFKDFGEIIDYSIDVALPSVTLKFKTRKDAETALLTGRHFQDRTLSVTWQNVPPSLPPSIKASCAPSNNDINTAEEDRLLNSTFPDLDEEVLEENEEALLQDDEDEEEEDRSWRR